MASSSGSRRFDVFPSFRGEDVRRTFLSYLLKEFDRRSIDSFIDNGIERSRLIGHELLSAIREARISIVIFSKNYASSTWCLNELMEIYKCYKELDQMVIPVFYYVDPSDVRKQTGEFGESFMKTCEDKTDDVKQRWMQALTDVANMAGEDLRNGPSEAHMVEKIANDVSNKLISLSNCFGDFVGIEDHLEAMNSILCLESNDARMVGIWGQSGIGKSTIGRALFSHLSPKFLFRNFSTYKCTDQDVSSMKLSWEQNFLREILGQKDLKIENSGVVKERLKYKKVLIVLDDVYSLEFLKTLVGEPHWFGPGSRIIVITQDSHLLKAHKIDHVYEVKFPDQDLALKILCRSAFGENFPPEGFKELAVKVAELAGNLPLGLCVLGSSLAGRTKTEWMELLPGLQNGVNGDILKTLRVTYNRLDDKDKIIFLYIAFLFNGKSVKFVNDFFGDDNVGLKKLAEKCLIRITPNEETIEMHNLLEKLGREIDRVDSKDSLSKRRFLIDAEEILDVFTNQTGTEAVLGIFFNLSSSSQIEKTFISMDEKSFEGMFNLQFLKISNPHSNLQRTGPKLHLPSGLVYLPRKLKFIDWDNCPLKCFPCNFKAEFLVELIMVYSNLEKLWEGTQQLGSLKKITMRGSKYLKEIPNLSRAINLKTIDFSYCEMLESFPNPINSKYLEYLNLKGCYMLRNFPQITINCFRHGIEIAVIVYLWNKNLLRLDYLECLGRCKSIKFRPELIVRLTVNGNTPDKLWKGVQSLGSLEEMDLSKSPNLKEIPDLLKATNLRYLYLSDCKSLVTLPLTIRNLQKLEKLEMRGCTGLKVLPIVNLSSLRFLDLKGCSSLKTFPQISRNIEILCLNDTAIEEVPCCIEMLPRLVELSMSGCSSLTTFPRLSRTLKSLALDDTAIEEVPCFIIMLWRLTELSMRGCNKLKNISPNIFRLTNLKQVDFTNSGSVITTLSNATVVSTIEDSYGNIEKRKKVDRKHACNEDEEKDEDEDEEKDEEKDEDEDKDEDDYEDNDKDKHNHWYFNFANCFKLEIDARELIIQSWFESTMVLPGRELPTYFKHRTYEKFRAVALPQSYLSHKFWRFKVCAVVEPRTYRYESLHLRFSFNGRFCKHFIVRFNSTMWKSDHLVLCSVKFRPTGLSSKLEFNYVEFKFEGSTRIKEFGIRLFHGSPSPDDSDGSYETESPDSRDGSSVKEYNQQSGDKCDVEETESSQKRMRMTSGMKNNSTIN